MAPHLCSACQWVYAGRRVQLADDCNHHHEPCYSCGYHDRKHWLPLDAAVHAAATLRAAAAAVCCCVSCVAFHWCLSLLPCPVYQMQRSAYQWPPGSVGCDLPGELLRL